MLLLFILLHTSRFVYSIGDIHTETRNVGRLVLIAPPLFGHMIPLLDFAKRLSVHHHVTYIVSVSKLNELKRLGFIDEKENRRSSQSRIEFIGLIDGNDDYYEVSCIILSLKK